MPLYRNRVAALFALLVLVLQGVLPLAGHARAAEGALVGTLCTVDGGVRTVDLGGGLPSDGGAGKTQKHCPLCAGSGSDRAQALTSSPVAFFASPDVPAEAPAAQAAAPIQSTPSSPAQPRAPPVQS